MKRNVLPVPLGRVHAITPTVNLLNSVHRKVTRKLPLRLGSRLGNVDTSLLGARPHLTLGHLLKLLRIINDNYCAISVAENSGTASVPGKVSLVTSVREDLNYVPVTGKDCSVVTGNQKTKTQLPVLYHVANLAPFAGGSPQKKGVIPNRLLSIKSVKGAFCVGQLSSANCVTNLPTVAMHHL